MLREKRNSAGPMAAFFPRKPCLWRQTIFRIEVEIACPEGQNRKGGEVSTEGTTGGLTFCRSCLP